MLAGRGPHIELLSAEFPGLPVIPLPGYHMRYAATPLGLSLKFPFMVARVFRRAALEHRRLQEIIHRHGIDVVIADQRFGCYSSHAHTVYISHQLCVKMPAVFAPLEWLVWRGLHSAAGRFDELWIPDYPGKNNLTGDLTNKYPLPGNHRFVGPLSRFATGLGMRDEADGPDVLVMLSGPEPQRSLLERTVLRQTGSLKGSVVVVRGKVNAGPVDTPASQVRVYPHLPGAELGRLIVGAKAVVCRGGYTTIMELESLRKRAVLVPTPGQTEQEYLCKRLAAQNRFVVEQQARLNLSRGLTRLQELPDPSASPGTEHLTAAVHQVVYETPSGP